VDGDGVPVAAVFADLGVVAAVSVLLAGWRVLDPVLTAVVGVVGLGSGVCGDVVGAVGVVAPELV
jgi:hypothetical protein